MAEQRDNGVSIERIDNLSIVSLKVSKNSIDDARGRLQLAAPLQAAGDDPRSLWFGPDRWMLVSPSMHPLDVVGHCNDSLDEILHVAVDYSSGLAGYRVAGPQARSLLASGSGVDFRREKFVVNSCCRTSLAQIAAIIVAEGPDQFDVYVDRSYGAYLHDWLIDTAEINSLATAS